MFNNIGKINLILDKKRKKILIILFCILLLVGLLETIGVGLIFPMLSMIFIETDSNSKILTFFQSNLDIVDKFQMTKIIVIVFCSVTIIKNILLVMSVWIKQKFILDMQNSLAANLLSVYLDKPISFHDDNNSASIVRNLITEIKVVTKSYIIAYINIFSELIFLGILFVLLLFVNLKMTLIIFVALSSISFIILFYHKNKLNEFGEIKLKYGTLTFKILKETLDSIKEIKINLKKDNLIRNFHKYVARSGKMGVLASVYGAFPRPFFESILIVSISVWLLFSLESGVSIIEFLPLLGLYLISFMRVMPAVNRILNNYQALQYSGPSFKKIFKDLKEYKTKSKAVDPKKIMLNDKIEFQNVTFNYDDNKNILESINLIIKNNTFTGVIGSSGSGKSTLLDVMLGFRKIKSGVIKIDDIENDLYANFGNWAENICYVPQSVYIYDESIAKNITFEEDESLIDQERLNKAIKASRLESFIENLPNKLKTNLGEVGDKISGGQKQRIGIARAIYKDLKIMIFDESTNALDKKTENEVLHNLKKISKYKIIIFATHSVDIINDLSDQIISIEKGKLNLEKKI